MRRTSVSLPTKHIAYDPHEKPDRYDDNRESSLIMKMQSAWVSQSQRARYFKTGAIIFVVVFLFYYFSPAGVEIYSGGRSLALSRLEAIRAAAHTCSPKYHQTRHTMARRPPVRRMEPNDAPSPTQRISRSCSTSP